jgi:uroporphyrinogen decarboxylase
MNNLFENRIQENGKTRVPVWFMRQAGRYHKHYQGMKQKNTFMELCKDPKLACEVTMGPIEDFDFDAAILFSDLLFPLEQLGMGLTYAPGPKLEKHFHSLSDFDGIQVQDAREFYNFQKEACINLRKALPDTKGLLGFVGAPFTLFGYAVEGSHAGSMVNTKKGLYDGRFEKYCEISLPNVLTEMIVQAEGGADTVCIFDTAIGECTLEDFKSIVLPKIKWMTSEFKKVHPETKIIYYSRNTHMRYLEAIDDKNIDGLGVDWRHDIADVLNTFSKDYFIQGNFDPCWLHLQWDDCKKHLETFYENILKKNADQSRWIMGLGHGVLQHTPEENVKNAIEYIHQNFKY